MFPGAFDSCNVVFNRRVNTESTHARERRRLRPRRDGGRARLRAFQALSGDARSGRGARRRASRAGQPLGAPRPQAGRPSAQRQRPLVRRAGAGKAGDVRIHDLRHSSDSRAPALGEGLPMIGKLLGHTRSRPPPAMPISPTIPSRPPQTALQGDGDRIEAQTT